MTLDFAQFDYHIAQIVQAAISAADPGAAVYRHLQRRDRAVTVHNFTHLLDEGHVFLVATGKAALPMAAAAAEILGSDLAEGVVITKKGREGELAQTGDIHPSLRVFYGGHPISDESSLQATAAVLEMLGRTTADDLVLCLISGGTSALLTQPYIPLANWQRLNGVLLDSGCSIEALNCVRRHLDRVKGGGLARAAAPAQCISLILSDVVGNPLHAIGSGPTVLHHDSPQDALVVLARYEVASRLSAEDWETISKVIEASSNPASETIPQPYNWIVGDVRRAADAAMTRAAQLGFLSDVLTIHLEGEARAVGGFAAALAWDLPPGRCYILGGETTVTVHGEGAGGRNQELALAAALSLAGCPRTVVASVATDGEDGTTDAAGAVVTGETVAAAQTCGLDPAEFLSHNDSYTFFDRLAQEGRTMSGGHVKTGPTGTNVNDLLFILKYPEGFQQGTLDDPLAHIESEEEE
ncbi:MAG: glycerate kinase [Anaerolineae bacterium]